MFSKIKVAIIGASGYTGVELIRILTNHKEVEIVKLAANSNAGAEIAEIFPHLIHYNLPKLQKTEEIDFSKIDVVFCCLPHAASQEIIKKLAEENKKLKIIDLSADFRLEEPAIYEKYYQHKHDALELQKQAVYGLTEVHRDKIKKAKLVANPGCYPTSVSLPLIPLLANNLIAKTDIISDSKSGTSGAGRSLSIKNLFCEVNESVKAYSIATHRHEAEIEQELSKAAKEKIEITFTPHLLPINRGIISTIYAKINPNFNIEDIKNCLKTRYEDEYFVHFTPNAPSIKDVCGTNFCLISAHQGKVKNQLILVSVIDNLVKGASGQAVQNMNIMFGFDEKTGLENLALVP